MRHKTITGVLCLMAVLAPAMSRPAAAQEPMTFKKDEMIVFLGNTLAERMRYYGYFETLLRSRHPDLNLQFRNLGWSADEVSLRPRPMNFGDIHTHLADQKADTVFLMYGLNESFAGDAGLETFHADLAKLIDELRDHRYNGKRAPRLVLVSPAPQEPIKGMPDVSLRNREIEEYVKAMAAVAEEKSLPFVDLYGGIRWFLSDPAADPITFNGIHFEDYGYWLMAQVIAAQIGMRNNPQAIIADMKTDQIQALGAAIRSREEVKGGFRIQVEGLYPPFLPLPEVAPEEAPVVFVPPIMTVTGLEPGQYGLAIGKVVVALGSAEQWAEGLPFEDAAFQELLESVRKDSAHKNQLFFDRWRAVNGFYIYGGRKEPFGVKSFPPELARFDELVKKEEAAINKRLQGYGSQELTFAQVGG